MQYENGFELLIAFVLSVITKLGGIGPKAQDLVIPFKLGEGEPLPDFYLIPLAIIVELLLTRYQTEQTNNLTGK